MKIVYGISLDGIEPHHLHQFEPFKTKAESPSRKKEVQSSKRFYLECPNTQDKARMWKEENAPNANISCIIATIKTLERFTGLRLHRICKTAYPLFVWMGHNDKILDYLSTFKCVNINKQIGEPFLGNPFTAARWELKNRGNSEKNIIQASNTLAKRLIGQGHNVSHITTVVLDGDVIFTALSRKDPLGLNEYNYQAGEKGLIMFEKTFIPQENLQQKPPLPSINTLIKSLGTNLFFPPTPIISA
jgi:hypothetical protein